MQQLRGEIGDCKSIYGYDKENYNAKCSNTIIKSNFMIRINDIKQQFANPSKHTPK